MMDPETVLQQVRERTAPAAWQILIPRRDYVVTFELALPLLLAICISGRMAVDMFVGAQDRAHFVLDICFGIWGLPLAVGVIVMYMRQKRAGDHRVLVITPEGFLEYLGGTTQSALTVSFQNSLISPHATQKGSKSLVVRNAQGRYTSWQPDIAFGPRTLIIERILAARDIYIASDMHSSAGGAASETL